MVLVRFCCDGKRVYPQEAYRHPTPTIDNASSSPLPFSIVATKRFLFGKDEEEEEEEEKGDAF